MDNVGGAVAGLLFFAIFLGFYCLPSIVALVRKVPNVGSVIVVNVFFGWTFIGWVVSLAMAARSANTGQTIIVQGTPGQYPSPYSQQTGPLPPGQYPPPQMPPSQHPPQTPPGPEQPG